MFNYSTRQQPARQGPHAATEATVHIITDVHLPLIYGGPTLSFPPHSLRLGLFPALWVHHHPNIYQTNSCFDSPFDHAKIVEKTRLHAGAHVVHQWPFAGRQLALLARKSAVFSRQRRCCQPVEHFGHWTHQLCGVQPDAHPLGQRHLHRQPRRERAFCVLRPVGEAVDTPQK